MVHSNAPYAFKHAMFDRAVALGARDLRADLILTQVVTSDAGREWRPVDQYVALARRHRLRVTLVLTGTPWWAAADPYFSTATCAANDPEQWAAWAGEIALRTRGTIGHFEIVNEPDHPGGYLGTRRQYALLLTATYRAIKDANPRATVLLGGLCSDAWIGALPEAFDVANVHLRGTVRSVVRRVRAWKAHSGARPLWVTEHGYPSATDYQEDPRYRGGERAQARYLRASLPAMIAAGADKVFVTLRDDLDGAYASEGVLGKPAFNVLRALIRNEIAR